jgi:peptidoglycan/LPS O-acetylase OafA/YrhL
MGTGASEPASERARGNNFDFLRFLLATIVVFSHSYFLLGLSGAHLGAIAVLGFFGLSGFLVTPSWLRSRSLGDYARKRALRIYPGFAAVVLFDYLLVVPLATGAWLAAWRWFSPTRALAETVLLQHGIISGVFKDLPVRTVNGSLWSVPYEAFCYVLVAVLGGLGVLGSRRALLGLTGALWAVQVVASTVREPDGVAGVVAKGLPYVTAFLVGAVLRVVPDLFAVTPKRIVVALTLMVLSLVSKPTTAVIWPFALPYVLIWVAQNPRVPFQRWGRYGDFSYGLYLYAYPMQQLLVRFSGQKSAPIALFVWSMALTMPLAIASWYLVERPFMRLKERRAATVEPPATAA